jgi:hypothetical protein
MFRKASATAHSFSTLKSLRSRLASRAAEPRPLDRSALFRRAWRSEVGLIAAAPVSIHPLFVPSHGAAALTASASFVIKANTPLVALELDSLSVLCGADAGEIPGVYRTAMLSGFNDAFCPRPAEVGSLIAPPSAVTPELFSALLRALDESCGCSAMQEQDGAVAFARDIRCFCLAARLCSFTSSSSSSSASTISTRHSLFWTRRGRCISPQPPVISVALADGYRAVLRARGERIALPALEPLAAAWSLLRRRSFDVAVAGVSFPVLAPVISSHFLADRFPPAASTAKKKSWSGFQPVADAKRKTVTVLRCRVSFGGKDGETDLVRVSSAGVVGAEAASTSLVLLSLAEDKDVSLREGDAVEFALID